MKDIKNKHPGTGKGTGSSAEKEEPLSPQQNFYAVVGESVVRSRESILGLLGLPFTLFNLRKKYLSGEYNNNHIPRHITPNRKRNHAHPPLLFIATNGLGLGHLTRCLAVAKRLKQQIRGEIVFLTTSPMLHLIHREGFTPYYMPSRDMVREKITDAQWEILLLKTIEDLLAFYGFSMLVFDGAIPYQSLCSVLRSSKGIRKVWLRRGSAKAAVDAKRQECEGLFDHIITPLEWGQAPVHLNREGKFFDVAPIVLLKPEELLSREKVRAFFGVSEKQLLVYVQLGAGKVNGIEKTLNHIVDILMRYANIIAVIGESPIGNPIRYDSERVKVIREYPNSVYFRGFDFAISACGYNSFHELIQCRLPTLFIPNSKTGADDQVLRANRAAHCALVLTDPNKASLQKAIASLCDEAFRESLIKTMENPVAFSGAGQTADILQYYYGRIPGKKKSPESQLQL